MKALFLSLFLAATAIGYAGEPAAASLVGTWELVSAKWPGSTFPDDFSGGLLKMFSKEHFMFVGRTTGKDGTSEDRSGGGTYTLNGEEYTETIAYHRVSHLVGQTIRFRLVITGDRMTVTGPVVGPNEKDPGFRLVEVYRRKD